MAVKLGNGQWAVKENNLLAYNDNSGQFFNKEFDFTRGSSATYVGKDGLIKTAGLQDTNLVQNGDFSQLSSELIVNGDFEDGVTGWDLDGTNPPIVENGLLKFSFSSGTYSRARQNNSSIIGNVKITYTVVNSSNNFYFQLREYGGGSLPTIPSTVGTHTIYRNFVGNGINFQAGGVDGGILEIDNVSVKQVDPNDEWTLGSGFSISDGKLKSINTANASLTIQSAYVFTIGKSYKLTFEISDYVEGSVRIWFGGFNAGNFNSNGTFSVIGVANRVDEILIQSIGSNNTYSIDNISVQEVQVNTPRIDFSDSVDGALLLEPQSTNLVTQSELFSGGSWGNYNSTTIGNQTTAPDGLLTASKFSGTSDVTAHTLYLNAYPVVSGNDYTYSVFAKKNESNFIQINTGQGFGNLYANFDLDNGVVGSFNTLDADIEPYLNGWFKCSVKANSSTSTGQSTFSLIQSLTDLRNPQFNALNNSVYIWGAMLEQNSFSTSYTPTQGSSSTRIAETCNNSGSEQDFNSEEGVLYAEISALANGGVDRSIVLSDGTTSNYLRITLHANSNRLAFFSEKGVNYNNYDFSQSSDLKMAFQYKENDWKIYINGTLKGTDTSALTFPPNTLSNLSFSLVSTSPLYGKVKNVQVFTTALSDEELIALTTI